MDQLPSSSAPRATRSITTPIYYVNDRPHIGHVYTTTICDVWARWQRFAGRDVFFLTGTDEHGVKVEKSAAAKGVPPQELADRNAAEFESILSRFALTNDDFIRTTQPRHVQQVQQIVQRLLDSDDIYLAEYEGWYDEGQEEFIPETKAAAQEYKSAVSGRPLVRTKEANFFFRLSKYQERLEKLYAEHSDFVRPEARRNEMLGRLREGLMDIPVSRTSFSWGIKLPGHDKHVLWVWIDALSNYITTLGVIDPSDDAPEERRRFWPADFHVIGKEILFFHAIFWPAMLMALDIPQPKCIYAHSFWISEGQKMSKSLGNFIDLEAINSYLDTYGLDAWRWYMLTQGPLSAHDANFAAEHFHETYTADLVNTVGNCASRVTAMIGKYFDGIVPGNVSLPPRMAGESDAWSAHAIEALTKADHAMDQFDLAGAMNAAMALVRRVDAYINETEPFKLAKVESQQDRLALILYNCAEAVRIASVLLWPAMPAKMEALWRALGVHIDPNEGRLREYASWGTLKPGTKVEKVALFPRVEMAAPQTA